MAAIRGFEASGRGGANHDATPVVERHICILTSNPDAGATPTLPALARVTSQLVAMTAEQGCNH